MQFSISRHFASTAKLIVSEKREIVETRRVIRCNYCLRNADVGHADILLGNADCGWTSFVLRKLQSRRQRAREVDDYIIARRARIRSIVMIIVALFDSFVLYLFGNSSRPLLGSELRDTTFLSRKKLDYVDIDALCNCVITALTSRCIKKRLITLRYLVSCSMTWMQTSRCAHCYLLSSYQPFIISAAIFNGARIFQSLSPLIVILVLLLDISI